jgi:putative addiction module killer protein
VSAEPKRIDYYKTADGTCPYERWIRSLKDSTARGRINARLANVRLGNFGNSRGVGEGVCELKIDYGPGYRVYYAQHGNSVVILLMGGTKQGQDDDIAQAKEYWADFKARS